MTHDTVGGTETPSYMAKQKILVAEYDLFDNEPASIDSLIDDLIAFRDAHKGREIVVDYNDDTWSGSRCLSFTVHRMETDEEANHRIAQVRSNIEAQRRGREEHERREFERLKAKFGS